MARKKNEPPTEAEMLDLTVAIESLTETVHVLQEEVRLLRETIRDDLGVSLSTREPPYSPRPVMHITSMPKDPLAPDFYERLNRYDAKNMPPEVAPSASPPAETPHQGGLFD